MSHASPSAHPSFVTGLHVGSASVAHASVHDASRHASRASAASAAAPVQGSVPATLSHEKQSVAPQSESSAQQSPSRQVAQSLGWSRPSHAGAPPEPVCPEPPVPVTPAPPEPPEPGPAPPVPPEPPVPEGPEDVL